MEEPALSQEVLAALDEIDRILHQMLMLAELSAGDGEINRPNLQIVLEHLQHKIDRIADRIS
jgi:AAA15 family ATPase/GTPase